MRKKLIAGLILVASTLSLGAEPAGVRSSAMDDGVRPQDDLFGYANGAWLREVPIPDDRSRYGIDSVMQETAWLQQRTQAEQAKHSTYPQARKVGDFYTSFMDEAAIERLGLKPLKTELQRIDALSRPGQLAPAMAHLDLLGVNTALGSYVEPDAGDPRRYAFWLTQSGLGLPDRDYYLSDDAKMADVRARYRAHIAALLRLAGEPAPDDQASAIFDLESRIAKIQWAAADRRDPQKSYNPRTLRQLAELAPAVDWRAYAAEQGLPSPMPVIVARQPDYLANLSMLIRDVPLSEWRGYLKFRLLSASAPYLSKVFADEAFHFDEQILHGVQRPPERWKRACETIDQLIGEASGRLYVEAYFPAASKVRAAALIGNLIGAYHDAIERSDWMGRQTKAEALAKLGKLTVKIGYPDHWRDYSTLTIRSDDLLGNVLRAQSFEARRKRAQLAGPVDRGEWAMTAPTVDAYYEASTNEIALPAGILQPPLYDPAADDAYNYGSTGATIGHEISHGFDNRGSRFDGDGALRNWWTDEDHRKYDEIADRLVRQFDAFEPLPGYHIDGRLTLSENIADLAGLEIAYQAYLRSLRGRTPPVIDGLTGEQRFFIGYAQSYMGKRRDSLLIAQLKSNPHSPEKYRVNGIVPNLDGFYDAFKLSPSDGLYLAPEKRVRFW